MREVWGLREYSWTNDEVSEAIQIDKKSNEKKFFFFELSHLACEPCEWIDASEKSLARKRWLKLEGDVNTSVHQPIRMLLYDAQWMFNCAQHNASLWYNRKVEIELENMLNAFRKKLGWLCLLLVLLQVLQRFSFSFRLHGTKLVIQNQMVITMDNDTVLSIRKKIDLGRKTNAPDENCVKEKTMFNFINFGWFLKKRISEETKFEMNRFRVIKIWT